MATTARQQYFADENSLSKERREFSIADEVQEKIDSVEEGAQVNKIDTIKVNGTALIPDANKAVNVEIPAVIDNLYTISSNDALSAKQGKILYDYIQNLLTIGRFLSNWDSATGLPITNPSESPYIYKAGDYYRVSNIATSPAINYKPDGSSFIIGQASTTVETGSVSVSDLYLYDGTTWILLSNSGSEIAIDTSLSTTSTNPVENRVITNALNGKQEALIAGNNIQIAADGKTISATDTTYSAGANISIDANNEISAVDTIYTAGDGININANNVISNTLPGATVSASAPSSPSEGDLWYDTANDALKAYDGTSWNIEGTRMTILKYGISTWDDFITAYNDNAIVYCRASNQSNPATGTQTRMAFMAYVNNETTPTEVEFQYYRSRSDHNSAANQLDQVFVYKLTSASGGTWTVTERNTAAKSTAGTGISLTYSSGNMTIANTGVTSFNGDTGAVTYTAPVTSVNGQTGAVVLNADNISDTGTTNKFVTQTDKDTWDGKQDELESGVNIRTINGTSILGSGDITTPVGGDVYGPSSATNGHLAVFDGATGKIIKDGGAVPTVPTKVSDLTNDSGYLTSSTGVTSFNGNHGAVTYTAPVTSVNNSTGAVTVSEFSPGGTATTGYVVTKTANGYEWQAPSGGIEVDSASPIQLTKIWAGTQAQYEALGSYDSTTVYLTI